MSYEMKSGTLPCSVCGKPIQAMLPFIGCVYCEECMKPFYWSGGGIANSIVEKNNKKFLNKPKD